MVARAALVMWFPPTCQVFTASLRLAVLSRCSSPLAEFALLTQHINGRADGKRWRRWWNG